MKRISTVCAVIALATPAVAQEFTGGELGFEYNQLTDNGDLDGANYYAGLEIAFNRQFSVGVNLSQLDFVIEQTSATVHGIYHLNDITSLGAFYAAGENDLRTIGVEGGIEILGGDVGAYLGQLSDGSDDAFVFGLDSNTPLGGSDFSLFTDFYLVGDSDLAVSTSEIGVSYTISGGPDLFVQVGQVEAAAAWPGPRRPGRPRMRACRLSSTRCDQRSKPSPIAPVTWARWSVPTLSAQMTTNKTPWAFCIGKCGKRAG